MSTIAVSHIPASEADRNKHDFFGYADALNQLGLMREEWHLHNATGTVLLAHSSLHMRGAGLLKSTKPAYVAAFTRACREHFGPGVHVFYSYTGPDRELIARVQARPVLWPRLHAAWAALRRWAAN